MRQVLRPQSLTEKAVKVVFLDKALADEKAEWVAWAYREEQPFRHYVVTVCRPNAQKEYAQTPLAKIISYDYFEVALLLHEIAHVDFETLDYETPFKDAVIDYLVNILVDAKDEYGMAHKYPQYSPYLQLVMAALRYIYPSDPGTGIDQDLRALFRLVRFGLVTKDADLDLLNFALPLVLSSLTGTTLNAHDAALALYVYLMQKHTGKGSTGEQKEAWNSAKIGRVGGTRQKVPITQVDLEDIGQVVLESAARDLLEQVRDGVPIAQVAGGSFAGRGGIPLHIAGTGEFYRQTCEQFASEIEFLRREFTSFYEKFEMMLAVEGELSNDPAMQQELYLASFTGDEPLSYELPEPLIPSLSLCIARDVSQSTKKMKVLYAQAMVIILEAVNDIVGFESALIDFNWNALPVKCFEDELDGCGLEPQASGGTSLDDTLDKVDSLSWNEQLKLLFVITDGDIDNFDGARVRLRRLELERGIVTWLILVRKQDELCLPWPVYDHAFSTSVRGLPEAIASHVLDHLKAVRYG